MENVVCFLFLSQVCQRWHHISLSADLWQHHCRELGRVEGVGDLVTAVKLGCLEAEGRAVDWKWVYRDLLNVIERIKKIVVRAGIYIYIYIYMCNLLTIYNNAYYLILLYSMMSTACCSAAEREEEEEAEKTGQSSKITRAALRAGLSLKEMIEISEQRPTFVLFNTNSQLYMVFFVFCFSYN